MLYNNVCKSKIKFYNEKLNLPTHTDTIALQLSLFILILTLPCIFIKVAFSQQYQFIRLFPRQLTLRGAPEGDYIICISTAKRLELWSLKVTAQRSVAMNLLGRVGC